LDPRVRYAGRSHGCGDWLTPPSLLAEIVRRWGIDFDPCPYPRPEWDGLRVHWGRRCFVNPPYGLGVGRWLDKAILEIGHECTKYVVFLLHARTDTRWFHDYVVPHACEVYAVRGRVQFISPSEEGGPMRNPFPSIIVVFDEDLRGPPPSAASPYE